MPLVKSTDVFIERSLHLLETNPASTRISITYGSESKRQSKKKQHKITKPETTSSSSENKSFVSFKTYDPISGQLHKLKTHKTKELSKLLTALGPHGVSIPKPIKNADTQQKETIEQVPIKGFSTILTNTEIQEELTPEPERPKSSDQQSNNSASASTTTGGGSKKNKKKKGKR